MRRGSLASGGDTVFRFVYLLVSILLHVGSACAQDAELLSKYRLASGDVISINVLGEDDLKLKVRLTDAGTIQYPVLGEIRVRGMTMGDLVKYVTDGLKGRYLVDPKVTASIDEYRPFFINGEVRSPGNYPFVPGLTVFKAVSIAGGFKDRASKSKMFVIRDGLLSQNREKVELDTKVFPGDILTIEESFF